MSVQTAEKTAPAPKAAAALPFPLGARRASIFELTTTTTALGASAAQLAPIQLPAHGFLGFIRLEVTLTGSGGTSPAFTADAPFNVFSGVQLRTAAGVDLIPSVSGYGLYLMNKYSGQGAVGPYADKRMGEQYSATAPSAHFFIDIPCNLNTGRPLGSLPNMAANRSYLLQLTLNSLANVCSGSPTINVSVTGTAYYWTKPPATIGNGIPVQTSPAGDGTISKWDVQQISITPGSKYVDLVNVGSTVSSLIFVLRNSSSARIDTNGWPTSADGVSDFILDNQEMFYLPDNEWAQNMVEWFGLSGGTRDAAQGLDTGVRVLPFHVLMGGLAGDPANVRDQLLPTLDASQLQLKSVFGSAVSTLEVYTNSVVPTDTAALYAGA